MYVNKLKPINERRFVGVKETILYGIANGGQTLSYAFISSWITYFFVNVLGIPPQQVAFMLLVVGIWDAINDPLMGSLIDKTRTRFGKLRPFLFLVPIPLALATVLMFSGPLFFVNNPGAAATKVLFMYVSYIIWEFFYTIGDVPFWGMSAAVSPSERDRIGVITSARFLSGIIGALPGIIISPIIDLAKDGKLGMSEAKVFALMGAFIGIVGMAIFALSGIFVRERVPQSVDEPSVFESFKYMFKNKPLLIIMLANMLGALSYISDTIQNFYFIDVLGSATLGLIIGIPGVITGFMGYALLPLLKRKFNNKQIVILLGVLPAIITGTTYFIGLGLSGNQTGMVILLAIRGAMLGLLNSIRMVVPTEMMGDTVDYMENKTGVRSEGMNFSVLTFISKFSNTVKNSIGTWMLYLIGYVEKAPQQTPLVQDRMWVIFTIVPALLGLLGVIPFLFYDLVGDNLEDMREELQGKRLEISEQETAEHAVNGKAGE